MNGDLYLNSELLIALLKLNKTSVLCNSKLDFDNNEMNIESINKKFILDISKDIPKERYTARSLQILNITKEDIRVLRNHDLTNLRINYASAFVSEIMNWLILLNRNVFMNEIKNNHFVFEIDNHSDLFSLRNILLIKDNLGSL